MAPQNVSHRLIGQAVTHIGQASDDAVISPASILTRHAHHQSLHVRLNGGAAWILCLEPSNVLATQATSRSALRPTRFPISAKVPRAGSLNRNLDGSFALRIRLSAARYSFCRRGSWFTDPVTYASSCNHFLFLMRNCRSYSGHWSFEFIDHSRLLTKKNQSCFGWQSLTI